jgi:flagellar assembly factor FliW
VPGSNTPLHADEPPRHRDQSNMLIATSRFGAIEATEQNLIHFESGLIGFPRELVFALVPHGNSTMIAWLQSATTPELAFPVVSAHGLVDDYPDVPIQAVAEKAGLGRDLEQIAILAVLCASQSAPATINLLAPILVDAESRRGAQVFLEGSRFTTRELFMLPAPGRDSRDASAHSAGAAPAP